MKIRRASRSETNLLQSSKESRSDATPLPHFSLNPFQAAHICRLLTSLVTFQQLHVDS